LSILLRNLSRYALECRIYAEDSYNDFLPSTGKIYHYKSPSGPGVRLDSGFEEDSEVSVYYDPLISKLITWGADKEIAVKRMKRALSEYQIAGVTTNISFLKSILEHPEFLKGSYDINFVENVFMPEGESGVRSINKDLNNAAALMSALLLSESKNNIIRSNGVEKNKWQEQLFDE
jgi:acetyl/propionyl-CoA carboxylase alpha subunit